MHKLKLPSIAISFDFESSAQSKRPNFYLLSKGRIYGLINKIKVINKDLSASYGRGYGNRVGAEKIIKIFNEYDIKATWFVTGHVLLKENINKKAFKINQKLLYATKKAGFTDATTWRAKLNSFYHEPYSDYKKYPYYYLGDITQRLLDLNHDIQCHSFSHPYVSMEPIKNLEIDLYDWISVAQSEYRLKPIIFAFPFLGDYHLIDLDDNLLIIPAYKKEHGNYKEIFLSNEKINLFTKLGFELFTRCGSLINVDFFEGFIPYRNSSIYCMKDKALLSFKSVNNFKRFIDEVIDKNAIIDLWLHPNDILTHNNFDLFEHFISILVKYRDSGKIKIATIKNLWEEFKIGLNKEKNNSNG